MRTCDQHRRSRIPAQVRDQLETAKDLPLALHELIKSVIHTHKRVVFNGNGYDDAWVVEAEKRGLLNLRSTTDCLPSFIAAKNVELFSTHRVLSETELHARYEIMTENYKKIICIEAMTMLDMARRDILPAASAFQGNSPEPSRQNAPREPGGLHLRN
jgi:glutamine synthetase